MKSTKVFFFVFLGYLFLLPDAFSQEQPALSILDSMVSKLKSLNYFEYQAKHQQKYFDSKDTLRTDWYSIQLQKVPNDSILNFNLKMTHSSESRIYDGEKLSLIWPQEELVQQFPVSTTKRNFFTNNIRRELIPRFFYEELPFQSYLERGTLTQFSETENHGKKYYKLQFDFPVDEEITRLQRTVYINSKTYLPEVIEGYAEFMKIQQEWSLLEINYEKTSPEKEIWEVVSYPSAYKIEYPNINQNPTVNSLSVGTPISEISTFKLNGEEFLLNFPQSDSTLYLVDFWFVGCAPCIKAMPELEHLHQKYQTSGLQVVGLNPLDQGRKDLVTQFKERLKITYDLLYVSQEIPGQWKVIIYPTIYLIKGGKVVYSKVGHRDEDVPVLEEQILTHIPKH